MTSRAVVAAVPAAALGLAVCLAGCGPEVSTGPASPVAWAQESMIHLEDGTVLEVDGDVTWFGPSGDGAFFTVAEGDDAWYVQLPADVPLQYVDGEGEITEVEPAVDDPGVSPDGNHVVWATPEDDYEAPRAVVVLDVASGERTAPREPAAQLGVSRITDDLVYLGVRGPRQTYDLDIGELTGFRGDYRLTDTAVTSPDGRWSVVGFSCCSDNPRRARSTDGDVARFDLPYPDGQWQPQHWTDDDTLVGVVSQTPEREVDAYEFAPGDLVACAVPSGECEEVGVDGGIDEYVVLPNDFSAREVTIQGPEESEPE